MLLPRSWFARALPRVATEYPKIGHEPSLSANWVKAAAPKLPTALRVGANDRTYSGPMGIVSSGHKGGPIEHLGGLPRPVYPQ